VAEETLNLLLVVDVPHPDHSVFTPGNQVFTVWTDCTAKYFVKVTIYLPVKFFTLEKTFLL
jgi:hypothetical protein